MLAINATFTVVSWIGQTLKTFFYFELILGMNNAKKKIQVYLYTLYVIFFCRGVYSKLCRCGWSYHILLCLTIYEGFLSLMHTDRENKNNTRFAFTHVIKLLQVNLAMFLCVLLCRNESLHIIMFSTYIFFQFVSLLLIWGIKIAQQWKWYMEIKIL